MEEEEEEEEEEKKTPNGRTMKIAPCLLNGF